MKANFIKTTDAEMANKLEQLGFKKVDHSFGIFTFLNNENLKFSNEIDTKKISYTDILFV